MNLLLPSFVLATFASFTALAGCGSSTVEVEDPPTKNVLGEACAFDDQCATRRCSADPIAGTCGECVTIQALGESCTGPHQGCSVSAICDGGVCRSTRKVLGEACARGPKGEDSGECDDELYCADVDGSFTTGICTARTPEGGACESYPATCAQGTACSHVSHRCEVPAPGSCAYGSGCPATFHCGADSMCHPGTLQQGALCGIVDGSYVGDICAAGLVCGSLAFPDGGGDAETSACLPLPGEGEPCIHDACAEGLFCRHLAYDGVTLPRCEQRRSEGDACSNSNLFPIECAEGLECRAETCQVACR